MGGNLQSERGNLQAGYRLAPASVRLAALIICGITFHLGVRAETRARVEWYWVNTMKKNAPDCIPLGEDPMSSLAKTFGSANMRVLHRSESPEGRLMVVEVEAGDGPTRFAYATTQLTCQKLKLAIAQDASGATSVSTVSPASLMAFPQDYVGRPVQFTARASGGLQPDSQGRMRVYIDDYRYLTPLLQGAVLRRWLDEGFAPGKVYTVTFRGKVRPRTQGSFVDFEVDDFRRD